MALLELLQPVIDDIRLRFSEDLFIIGGDCNARCGADESYEEELFVNTSYL